MRGQIFVILGSVFLALIFSWSFISSYSSNLFTRTSLWNFQAIDTMKYSRDLAQEKLRDEKFDEEIDIQVRNIAQTGATHIAIATPYDEKFLPFLERWVKSARSYHLRIWFRGNWSNWEGWFGYEKKMGFDEHLEKTVDFIKKNPKLFEDGDYFTGCPECENGAAGDPRLTGMVDEYRNFLISETKETKKAFESINKQVETNLLSMNRDVAVLVMDQKTAAEVGGIITIDHYVGDPKQLAKDIDSLSEKTGAKIVLGEFGAPIPDLTGDLNEEDQAKWLDVAFAELIKTPNLVGLSYWVNRGGSTEIWKKDNSPRKAVSVIKKYFYTKQLYGAVTNDLGNKLSDVSIKSSVRSSQSEDGEYSISIMEGEEVEFSKDGYETVKINIHEDSDEIKRDIVLNKQNPSWWHRVLKFLKFG